MAYKIEFSKEAYEDFTKLDGSVKTRIQKYLDKIAKEIGKTREEFIEEALECEVGERELVHIAESRAKEIREGRAETTSLEELKEKYGL